MAFNFENLDQNTRDYMLQEIEHDISSGNLYTSKRFSENGINKYPSLLKQATQNGNETTLATFLRNENCFEESESRIVKGKTIVAKVPVNAAEVFSEGEFNRFYIRALCRRAIEVGAKIQIYRAKESAVPRQESLALVGTEVEPERILEDLRTNVGVDTVLGLPPGPNSGLSARLA